MVQINNLQKINDLMQYCGNCQKTLPEDRFDLHLGYCKRNIKRCPDCKRPYDINNEQQHHEQFHNFESCQYCQSKIIPREMGDHKKNCIARPVECIYCQMSVPTDKYQDHRKQCEARTKPCQKCEKPITNKQYFEHVGKCKGKVAATVPSYSSSNSNSNVYYTTSYSQPVTTYISSNQSSSTSQPVTYYQSSSSNAVYSPSYSGSSSEQRPNVIRTYTRTYVPGQGQSGSTSVSYSGSSTSTPATTTTYISNSSSGSGTTTSYSSSTQGEGNVISRRVVSTRVISPDGTVIRQINNNSSSQPYGISSSNTNTSYTTYYRSPTTTTTPVIASSSTGNTYTTYQSPSYSTGAYDEDPELQAALLASLGYHDENSPALQQQLYKQFTKK